MKKNLIIWLIVGILAVVGTAIGYGVYRSLTDSVGETVVSDVKETPVRAEEVFLTEEEAEEEEKSEQNTLMIYMVGSDLESRSKAGTEDLTEMFESGINLENANVLVYTGGAKKWHNDLVTPEENYVLSLTSKGFQALYREEVASMGTSESLAKFVNYAYENYPAKSYALILWDHGNGPLIGYGKDMLFDNDSMTLSEMKAAMNQTPFGKGEKLAWVGFDACLMSSAELVCTWAPYANYLVASQEVEPSFGWNYGMLANYGSVGDTAFLSGLVDSYMNTCQAYYDDRGYEHRDTTLACLDLSYANSLEQGINRLFEKASSDVGSNYNRLVQKRVATRALGRASTGSEYDLIDLYDMAVQLEELYPEETEYLKNTVQKMVVKNGTNAQLTCGLSLYYPFYNKYYYEDSWKSVYDGLGVFSSYGAYLDSYQTHWLNDDNLDRYESSPVAQRVNEEGDRSQTVHGNYMAHLSPAQSATYADARFYILEREKGDVYHPVFVSGQVTYEDSVVYADFDGKAIFVKDRYGNRALPITMEYDSVDNLGRYTLMAYAHPYQENIFLDFQMSLDYNTEEVALSAILSESEQTDARALTGGKREEHQLEDWQSYGFPQALFRYLSRYDNGLVKPFLEWTDYGAYSFDLFPLRNGIDFAYEPLGGSEYYLMFEITDTQGNKYCSEPVKMAETDFLPVPTYEMPTLTYDWNQGERLELFCDENVTVYLAKYLETDYHGEPIGWCYRLEAQNDNDYAVDIMLDQLTFNSTDVDMGSLSVHVNAHATATSYSNTLSAGNLMNAVAGGIGDIHTIEGRMFIQDSVYYGFLLPATYVKVNISEEAMLLESPFDGIHFEMQAPYLDAMAEAQELYRDEDVVIRLEGFGTYNVSDLYGIVSVENLSDEMITVQLDGLCVNGITLDSIERFYVNPGKVYYSKLPSLHETGNNLISRIGSLQIHASVFPGMDVMLTMPTHSEWLPVALSQSGSDDILFQGENLLYEENGVRIFVDEYLLEYEKPVWYLIVENNNEWDIKLTTTDNECWNCDERIGAYQQKRFPLQYNGDDYGKPLTEAVASVYFRCLDWYDSRILWETDTPARLSTEDNTDNLLEIPWESGESCLIFQENGIEMYLSKLLYQGAYGYYDETTGTVHRTSYEEEQYQLVVKNSNDHPVDATVKPLFLNGTVDCGAVYINDIPANSEKVSTLNNLTQYAVYGAADTVDSIRGVLTVTHDEIPKLKLVDTQSFTVFMSEKTSINLKESPFYQPLNVTPYLDAMAEEQVLWETDEVRVTLLYFGQAEAVGDPMVLCYENRTDRLLTIGTDMLSVNGISLTQNSTAMVEPCSKRYQRVFVSDLDTLVSSLEELKIHLLHRKGNSMTGVADDSCWATVVLSESGKAPAFVPPETLIFDEYGVKMYLKGAFLGTDGYPFWSVVAVNENDFTVELACDYGYGNAFIDMDPIGPGQRARGMMIESTVWNEGLEPSKELLFRLAVADPYTYDRLYVSEEPILLTAGEQTTSD